MCWRMGVHCFCTSTVLSQCKLPLVCIVLTQLLHHVPVCVSPGVFSTNKRGYPVLSRAHQELMSTAFRFGVQVILTGG